MRKETVKFTVRLNPETAKRLVYIADYYGRSQNQQIAWLVKQCIAEFEREQGPIELE
ncbi:MAG: hypothetical protein NC311_08230 [Muribaculaceae bacterium]|nr:hypothetical protein [Muribaculaceae bacterium]MCM1439313.1 hypothetical protein [Roseburia sp.]